MSIFFKIWGVICIAIGLLLVLCITNIPQETFLPNIWYILAYILGGIIWIMIGNKID